MQENLRDEEKGRQGKKEQNINEIKEILEIFLHVFNFWMRNPTRTSLFFINLNVCIYCHSFQMYYKEVF